MNVSSLQYRVGGYGVTGSPREILQSYPSLVRSLPQDTVRAVDLGVSSYRDRLAASAHYVDHLLGKLLIAWIVFLVTFVFAWLASFDFALFARHGESFLHPALDVFLLIASVLLLVVSVCSGVTTLFYLARSVRKA